MHDITTTSLFYRKPSAPCKECADRFVGCHSSCEKYDDWSKKEISQKDQIINEKVTENMKKERQIKSFIKKKRW